MAPADNQYKLLNPFIKACSTSMNKQIIGIPFVAAYMDPTLTDTTPQTEDMKIILADPEAFKRGWESWDKW